MSLEQAMAEWESAKKAEVEMITFGHLAPKSRMIYKGKLAIVHTAWLGWQFAYTDFPELENSPWVFDDFHNWLDTLEVDSPKSSQGVCVWEWEGSYQKFKNGKYRMVGKFKYGG